MDTTFSSRFYNLRKAKRLSRAALADRAGIAARTIGYWEAGERLPRIPELELALGALEADAAERMLLLSLLTAPRAMQEARNTAAAQGEIWTDSGDLLRAMRRRIGFTQEQIAAQLGLKRSAVRRWENGEALISEENQERVFAALNALPAEIAALQSGRLLMPGGKAQPTLDDCEAELARMRQNILTNPTPLVDLQALALKRHLTLLATKQRAAQTVLALAERDHGLWLQMQERTQEAQARLTRAIHLLEAEGRPEEHWSSLLNMVGTFARVDIGQRGESSRFMQRWLSGEKSPLTRANLLCDAGLYMAQDYHFEEANRLLNLARRAADRNEEAQQYHQLSAMRARMYMETSEEALRWVLNAVSTPHFHTCFLLEWALILHRRGDKRAADQCLRDMETQYPLAAFPYRQHDFQKVADRISQ